MQRVELVFVFADLAGFTALTETHGDLDAERLVTRYEELARSVATPRVRLVKMIGDAAMFAADDAASALRAAIALRAAVDAEPRFRAYGLASTRARRSSETATTSAAA